ncbi:MAG: cold shock domain-containing protein [Proteobacteria bacterium]|nr:cold shock domain-containing protein [Pseudomonadota bacterium]
MLNEENERKEDKLISAPIILDDEYESTFVPESEELEREIEKKRNALGRVCWFNRQAGYGFVREDESSRQAVEDPELELSSERDLFFHQSAIQIPGKHELRTGQRIAFEVCRLSLLDINGGARFMALNIIPLKEKKA